MATATELWIKFSDCSPNLQSIPPYIPTHAEAEQPTRLRRNAEQSYRTIDELSQRQKDQSVAFEP